MSDKELADELFQHRHDEGEWSRQAEQVEVRPSRTAVVSCRLPLTEFQAVDEAAAHSGESVSEYVRHAIQMRLGTGRIPSIHTNSIGIGHVQVTLSGVTDWWSDAPQSFVAKDYPKELRVPA